MLCDALAHGETDEWDGEDDGESVEHAHDGGERIPALVLGVVGVPGSRKGAGERTAGCR